MQDIDLQFSIVATIANIRANSCTSFLKYKSASILYSFFGFEDQLKETSSQSSHIREYLISNLISSTNQDTYLIIDY